MSTNRRRNEAAIKQFRKELQALLDDITDVDVKVLNEAVNKGVAVAKENTNVVTGIMRREWKSTRTVKTKKGEVKKTIYNTVEYAPHVNYGHRIVNKNKETVGWVKGQYMLEKAITATEKELVREFRKEIERLKRKHDK